MAVNNNRVRQIVTGGITTAAILGAWGYAATRASEKDVEAIREQQHEAQKETNRRLRVVENNSLKICQFLSRQDRKEGGPGLGCKDPQ